MPLTPRRMAQLKANFRAGQANYNRLVTLHKNIQRMNKELTNTHNKLTHARMNEYRAHNRTLNQYPTPAMMNKMSRLWQVKMRKANAHRQALEGQHERMRTNMTRAMTEFARLHWGAEPNNNVVGRVRRYVRTHNAPNIRLGRMKLAHAINRAAVRPGGWAVRRMFRQGNNIPSTR